MHALLQAHDKAVVLILCLRHHFVAAGGLEHGVDGRNQMHAMLVLCLALGTAQCRHHLTPNRSNHTTHTLSHELTKQLEEIIVEIALTGV